MVFNKEYYIIASIKTCFDVHNEWIAQDSYCWEGYIFFTVSPMHMPPINHTHVR